MTGEQWLEALDRIGAGDRVALARVTQLVTGYLARFGAYQLRDSWTDLCQEVLIKLLRSAREGKIDEPNAFVAYVGTVTRNSLVDWQRRNARHQSVAGSEDDEDPLSDDALLARAGLVVESDPDLHADLGACLEALPEAERQVVGAVYLEGRSYEEAAEALGVPLGTLKRRQTQGLKALRECMGIGGSP